MSLEKILGGVGKIGDVAIKAVTSGRIRKTFANGMRKGAEIIEGKPKVKKEPVKKSKSKPKKKKAVKEEGGDQSGTE